MEEERSLACRLAARARSRRVGEEEEAEENMAAASEEEGRWSMLESKRKGGVRLGGGGEGAGDAWR